jgi:hypothetical protein
VDLIVAVALLTEVLHRVGRRREQEVAEPVGHDAVDLLRHRPVAAAEAGFDVGDGATGLGGHEPTGDRAVDVADDDHDVG